MFFILMQSVLGIRIRKDPYVLGSVADPDPPDPHIFVPPRVRGKDSDPALDPDSFIIMQK
jgi:hypothetical protein